MSEEDKRAPLYESLCLIEDFLVCGIRNQEQLPDFKPEQKASVSQEAESDETGRKAEAAPNLKNPRAREDGAKPDSSSRRAMPVASIALTELALSFECPPNDSLEKIARECADCRACRLFANRNKAVAGSVTDNAKVLIIGDTPSLEDDKAARLFAGAQGELLTKMLDAIGLSAENDTAYLSVTKCRTPDREPAPDEAMHCSAFMLRQLCLVKTPLVLAFGRVASQSLTGKTRESLPALRGTAHEATLFEARKIICTYHPRDILANAALKRPVWEDLKLLQSLL